MTIALRSEEGDSFPASSQQKQTKGPPLGLAVLSPDAAST